MTIKTRQDLLGMKRIGRIVGATLREMQQAIRPGMTTRELDSIAADFMAKHGARSAPALLYDFPGVTCISINAVAVHGIPDGTILQPGDMVTCDVTAELDGYIADAAVTVILPPAGDLQRRMEACTRAAFKKAMAVARAGEPINVIGKAIEREVQRHGFTVMIELHSHGVGRYIHEPPSIPNFYLPRARTRLQEGMVITIEPIIAAGSGLSVQDEDRWTVRPRDGSLSAHYEHTVMITKGQPVLLTAV